MSEQPSVTMPRPSVGMPAPTAFLVTSGLVLFVITIVIGILNGIDAVEFSRDIILTHVHAGTLGWLTLAISGLALWLFARPDDDTTMLARLIAGAVVIYIVAFATGDDVFRPVAGTLLFVVVVWLLVWIAQRSAGVMNDVPRFAMLLAIVSLTIGAVMGILLGLAVTGKADWVPTGVAEAHPPTMVIGYLVLAALGIAEWRLTGSQAQDAAAAVADGRPPRLGQIQVVAIFVAGLLLVLGIILDVEALLMLNAPFQIGGMVIFLKRLWGPLRAIDWTRGTARFLGATAVFLVLNTILIVVLIAQSGGDPDKIEFRHVLALDHMMFIGVLTNALFAVIGDVLADRQSPVGAQVAFVGVNLGLVIFVAGLMLDVVALKRVGTPILGLALLHAIATAVMHLPKSSTSASAAT